VRAVTDGLTTISAHRPPSGRPVRRSVRPGSLIMYSLSWSDGRGPIAAQRSTARALRKHLDQVGSVGGGSLQVAQAIEAISGMGSSSGHGLGGDWLACECRLGGSCARRLAGSASDAEDLVQETYMRSQASESEEIFGWGTEIITSIDSLTALEP